MNQIRAWFAKATTTIRAFFGRIGAFFQALWLGLTTWITAIFRRDRGRDEEGMGDLELVDRDDAAEVESGIGQTGLRGRLARIGGGIRRFFTLIGKGIGDLWRLSQPISVRIFRQGVHQSGLLIRKIGVKQRYRYSVDPNPLHQFLSDGANALAIVVGVGSWPHLQAWGAQTLPAPLAPHYWVLGLLGAIAPLVMVYLRWQQARQTESKSNWDILTLTLGWVGCFALLFAGTLMLALFIEADFLIMALACAVIATVAWLLGEGVNSYTILIRRPYTPTALLSLGKSLLFMLTGWLILTYLPVVQLFNSIQLQSAAFLFTIFRVTALIGLLISATGFILTRLKVRLPALDSLYSGQG